MKIALVTGGGQGLGEVIAKTLAKSGYRVLIHYRTNKEKAFLVQQYCQGLGCESSLLQADLSIEKEVKGLCSQIKSLDLLVNNVGPYFEGPLSHTDLDDFRNLIEVNLFAPFALSKELLPLLKKSKGSVVNIGVSGLQGQRAVKISPAYHLAKGALLSMTKSMAKEMAPYGVRFNMVSPGYMENSVTLPEKIDFVPMKRLANLEEVARVVLWLSEQEQNYICGQNIEVAGGFAL